jgi:hypothetical protein
MITNSPVRASSLRDIKPPVDIPSGWGWLWWVLAVLVILAVLFLLWRWWQRRTETIPVVPPVPAHVRARQRLREALTLIARPKPFCIAVSDAVRTYLEDRFNFRAPERTTEEFLRELNATHLLADRQKESLGGFLAGCDLVKFAKYEPGEPELRELSGAAMRLVDETAPQHAENSEKPPHPSPA